MIRLEELSLKHGSRQVVENINLELKGGRITTIVGRNGAGKSTLLAAASGDMKPARGRVYYGSRELPRLGAREKALCRACLLQTMEASFPITASELIEFGVYPAYDLLTAQQRK